MLNHDAVLTRLSGVEDLEGLATVRRACTETVDFLEIAALSADIFDMEIWGLIVSIGIRSLPHMRDRTVIHPFETPPTPVGPVAKRHRPDVDILIT